MVTNGFVGGKGGCDRAVFGEGERGAIAFLADLKNAVLIPKKVITVSRVDEKMVLQHSSVNHVYFVKLS